MIPSFRHLESKRQREPGFGAALGLSAAAHALLITGILLWGSPPRNGEASSRPGGENFPKSGPEVRFVTLKPPPAPSKQANQVKAPPLFEASIAAIETVPPTRERRLPGAEEGVPATLGVGAPGSEGSASEPGIVGGSGGGTGVSGEGAELLAPRPRYTVLPPLDRPASVRGKSFQVRFWVDPLGKVTRVEVSPEIPDAEYRKKFLALMYEYTFEPARRPDGTPVAGTAVLTITL